LKTYGGSLSIRRNSLTRTSHRSRAAEALAVHGLVPAAGDPAR
jgi:hypothetical protein